MELRRGMWVTDQDGAVAIFSRTRYPKAGGGWKWFQELHYVDENGNTIGVYTSNQLSKATNILGFIDRNGDDPVFSRVARNDKGLFVPASDLVLTQAKHLDIPEPRRPAVEDSSRLGYE